MVMISDDGDKTRPFVDFINFTPGNVGTERP